MADTVDTLVVFSGSKRRVVRLTNISDGTGESSVVKVDRSAITGPDGTEPSKLVVERIEYDINGMNIRLHWDHTTDDEIAVIAGAGYLDWRDAGGLVDPGTPTDQTGDILLTTNGHAVGDTYNITLWVRLKD